MAYEYFPQSGQLVVESSMGYGAFNSTATAGNATTPTTEQSTIPLSVLMCSCGLLVGGIIGAVLGGFVIGALVLWAVSHLCRFNSRF